MVGSCPGGLPRIKGIYEELATQAVLFIPGAKGRQELGFSFVRLFVWFGFDLGFSLGFFFSPIYFDPDSDSLPPSVRCHLSC